MVNFWLTFILIIVMAVDDVDVCLYSVMFYYTLISLFLTSRSSLWGVLNLLEILSRMKNILQYFGRWMYFLSMDVFLTPLSFSISLEFGIWRFLSLWKYHYILLGGCLSNSCFLERQDCFHRIIFFWHTKFFLSFSALWHFLFFFFFLSLKFFVIWSRIKTSYFWDRQDGFCLRFFFVISISWWLEVIRMLSLLSTLPEISAKISWLELMITAFLFIISCSI